ncbi:uncharacterized protein LOC143229350 isoform X1 [Tachypleus tridentatus]|uniref:uncharacterized protein LOC143229350 isoform X1 n=1 Tax=Tachypleus tridentatus TaxID=6853 RepID=UPI003FD20EB8
MRPGKRWILHVQSSLASASASSWSCDTWSLSLPSATLMRRWKGNSCKATGMFTYISFIDVYPNARKSCIWKTQHPANEDYVTACRICKEIQMWLVSVVLASQWNSGMSPCSHR